MEKTLNSAYRFTCLECGEPLAYKKEPCVSNYCLEEYPFNQKLNDQFYEELRYKKIYIDN